MTNWYQKDKRVAPVTAFVVTKNEEPRYLEACLSWLKTTVDRIFVCDDRSDDATVEIANKYADHVIQRIEDVPSFQEHEGRFRQYAWEAFQFYMNPDERDWILSIDADEFMVSTDVELSSSYALQETIQEAIDAKVLGVKFHCLELWNLDPPEIRLDGFWATNSPLRLFKYQPDGKIPDREMACGSVPDYVTSSLITKRMNLLHAGYATWADRRPKYDLYVTKPGHNRNHIGSIVSYWPTLEAYRGQYPQIYRGRQ